MYNFCENEIYDEIAYQVDNVSMGSRTGLHSAIILAVRIVSGTTFTRNQWTQEYVYLIRCKATNEESGFVYPKIYR